MKNVALRLLMDRAKIVQGPPSMGVFYVGPPNKKLKLIFFQGPIQAGP